MRAIADAGPVSPAECPRKKTVSPSYRLGRHAYFMLRARVSNLIFLGVSERVERAMPSACRERPAVLRELFADSRTPLQTWLSNAGSAFAPRRSDRRVSGRAHVGGGLVT